MYLKLNTVAVIERVDRVSYLNLTSLQRRSIFSYN